LEIKYQNRTEFLDWNESPTTTVFGKNIPVTYLINPAIRLFKSKIEEKIDASKKSMNFKPNVLTALEKNMRPFRNEDYESWLRITLEIHTTASKLKKG
jgi:hypothetical protein